jgi:hypothetical protein
VGKRGRDGQTTKDIIRRMRSSCWITEATDTHSEYVIKITAIRLQQWLPEHDSMKRYTRALLCVALRCFAAQRGPRPSQAWGF